MNYWYQIDAYGFDPDEAALRLAKAFLPVCVVQVGDEYGLALTGGGMDLSWEICEAFIVLGYLPPAHFCSLPAMAGMTWTAKNRRVVAACRRSLRVMGERLRYQAQALGRTAESLKAETARRAEVSA